MIKAFITGCSGLFLTPEETKFMTAHQPWGLILFKRNCQTPDQLRELTESFRAAVGRKDAPVFIDQEGGRVQRLSPQSGPWRQYPSARSYGKLFENCPLLALRATRHVGRLMAEDLMDAGITANCLPVLDVPQPSGHDVIGNRAYALRNDQIMIIARAHTAGLMDGGVMPVMKHIPGHGRAEVDSHLSLPIVKATRAELEQVDFPPFAALADLPMAMTAHVVYTALDADNPCTTSRKIISGVIRKLIGFRGLLMTDDLSMKALSGTNKQKIDKSLAAGCDIILHCNGVLSEMEDVAAHVGELSGKSMQRAKMALKSRHKPFNFEKKIALQDLEAVLMG
jgi:beta-N-acetylhexosaminidase